MICDCWFTPRVSRYVISAIKWNLIALALISGTLTANASTLAVPANGNLQAAINLAQPGDTIIVEAGANYSGGFVLPVKSGSDYITIQSSRAGELPEGVRVGPGQSGLFAKLQSTLNGEVVIRTEAGAHHYRFIGIEFSAAQAGLQSYDLVRFGDGRQAQTTMESVPHHLVIDRCYIHGFATQEVQRGVTLNSAETSVINSYISDIHGKGYDTQAVAGWNGPGPFHIVNNYLEAAGENVMFGGADPGIANLVPSDIEIRSNYFFKPLSWKVGHPTYGGIHWTVKNLLELKNARNVVIDGNVLENNWVDAQSGVGVLFTVRNQEGTAPWSVIENVTFTNNVLKNSQAALNLLGSDYNYPSRRCTGLTIANNLFTGINATFLLMQGYHNVTVEHNTHFQSGNIMTLYGDPSLGFIYRNNLTIRESTGYGVKGDATGEGTVALETFSSGYSFPINVLVSANPVIYPANNFLPSQVSDVGLTDYAGGNYRLLTTSPFHNAASDGKDIGIDFDALNAALGGSGASTATPSPTPTSFPTPTPTPTPAPTTQTGLWVRKAKTRGQNLSNQLSSSGGTSSSLKSSAAQMNLTSSFELALLIAEIQEAQVQFNLERELHPAARRIELELFTALQCALQAQVSFMAEDLTGFKADLREAIDHLELSGVLIANPFVVNPIDVASYVVRQHYIDFLDREPDQGGDEFWVGQLNACGTDAHCFEDRRIHISAAFFLSTEFQQTGYFVHRVYKSSYRRVPTRVEFMPDNSIIGQGVVVGTAGWEARLAANKEQFLQSFVQRPVFISRYSGLSNSQYVDALIFNIAVTITTAQRNALVQDLENGASRASILGRLSDNEVFAANEFNRAFVLMQYFGYLRRDFDNAGFTFWLDKLDQFGGNYQSADMVKAFLASQEYRSRFRL